MQKIKTRSVSGNEEKGIFSGILFCADVKQLWVENMKDEAIISL